MIPNSYSTFYTLNNRQLSVANDGLSQPWTNFLDTPAYVLAQFNASAVIPLSLSSLLEKLENPDSSSTCEELFNSYLQNNNYQEIYAPYIPTINAKTGVYDNRIEVVDIQSSPEWVINLFDMNYPLQTPTLNDIGTTDDLSITPPSSVNPNDVLIAINGILHKTEVNNGVIWVLDGLSTIKQSEYATVVGLITTKIGGHTCIPITSDMVKISSSNGEMSVVLSSSTLNFENTSLMLSIDGYLQMFNNTYTPRDNSSVILHVNKLDYINNFIYSPIIRTQYDVFGLMNSSVTFPNGNTITEPVNQGTITRDRTDPNLSLWINNPAVPVSTLQSTSFLQERLTSPHSFIISLNNPWLFIKDYQWQPNNATTCFECFLNNDVPRGTLFVDIGWVFPYTVLSNPIFPQHLLYVDSKTYHSEIYQTGYNLLSYPAPYTDITHHPLPQRAWMREVYTGTLPS